MNKLILWLIIILFSHNIYSQSCLPDGIYFTNQNSIDNFPVQYPECTEIEGWVIINDPNGYITDLSPLIQLTKIGGDLQIYFCPNIKNLQGLNNLTQIGGDFSLSCDSINDISAMGSLQSIGGSLSIVKCLIKDFEGLNNIEQINGNFGIIQLDSLNNFHGLESLTNINRNLSIKNISQSISLEGLGGLTEIGGDLELSHLDEHFYLNGLSNLERINGSLQIWSTSQLDLYGLESLNYIGDELSLSGNDVLHTIQALEGVSYVGGRIYIQYNHALENLDGLENIQAGSVGDVYIEDNILLSDCNVESVCNIIAEPPGLVFIGGNDNGCKSSIEVANACNVSHPCLPFGFRYLTSQLAIDKFSEDYPDCTDLVGFLSVSGSDINNLDGLSQLTRIRGGLKIGSDSFPANPLLTNLNGLNNITQLGGLMLSGNLQLTNLEALENIQSTGGLTVRTNEKLESLNGLQNIESLNNGSILIVNNPLLNDIDAIDGIKPESISGIVINDNPALSICSVNSICFFLLSSNNAVVLNNAPGCQSVSHIIEGCGFVSCPGGILQTQEDVENFFNGNLGCNVVSGDLIIDGSDIENLSGFSDILSIDGSLIINNTSYISDLSGFENLTTITGNLIIGDNNKSGNLALESLDGLEMLTLVGGDIVINNNPVLFSIEAISSVNPDVINSIVIENNPLLDHCAVQSVCDYLSGVSANTLITNNGSYCSSEDAVMEDCQLGIYDPIRQGPVVYPNPANNWISLKESKNFTLIEIRFYSALGSNGKTIKVADQTVFDISGLSEGLYIVEFLCRDSVYRSKIIISR